MTSGFLHVKLHVDSISDQKYGQYLYPFSDQNGSKTIPFGVAHTCKAYIGEYPPPPPLPECTVPGNIQTSPMEGHWKLRAGGGQNPQFLKESI